MNYYEPDDDAGLLLLIALGLFLVFFLLLIL